MNLKKPVLAVIGVGGACAVCCAIPLAIPFLAGFSAAGITALFPWGALPLNGVVLAVAVGLVASVLAAGLWRWSRSPKTSACSVDIGSTAKAKCDGTGSGAGCGCP